MNEKWNAAAQRVAKELGYKSYDDEWGREHLVDGPHGDSFFSATDLDAFYKLVSARLFREEAVQLVTSLKGVIYEQIIKPTTHCPTDDSPFRQAERFIEKYGR